MKIGKTLGTWELCASTFQCNFNQILGCLCSQVRRPPASWLPRGQSSLHCPSPKFWAWVSGGLGELWPPEVCAMCILPHVYEPHPNAQGGSTESPAYVLIKHSESILQSLNKRFLFLCMWCNYKTMLSTCVYMFLPSSSQRLTNSLCQYSFA